VYSVRSSILRPKHRAYYRSGRPVIKISPKGALGSHEIHPINSAPSLGQSIVGLIQNMGPVSVWGSQSWSRKYMIGLGHIKSKIGILPRLFRILEVSEFYT